MKRLFRCYLCMALSLALLVQTIIPVYANEFDLSVDEVLTAEEVTTEDIGFDDEDSNAEPLTAEDEELSIEDNETFSADLSSDSNGVDADVVFDIEESQEDVTEIKQAYGFPDEDLLFAKYADEEFGVDYFDDQSTSNGIEPEGGGSAYLYLNDVERVFYDKALQLIEAVANGEENSTEKAFTPEELGLQDLALLDVEDLYDCTLVSGTWTPTRNADKYSQAVNELKARLNIDMKKILDALTSDHPEWLYWFGRSYSLGIRSISSGGGGSVKVGASGTTGTMDGYVRTNFGISFTVSKSYAATSVTPCYETDVSKTGATKTAVANAKSIAASYATLGDYNKLLAFKEKICDMVTYNGDAAHSGVSDMGSDPWELIYVFDNNLDTNVVCEGYAKAFQYLCDLSTFNNNVDVICVNGKMNGGGHRWNIVKYNGSNFLVDVTNCDNMPEFQNGHTGLFMKGYSSGNVSSGYVVTRERINITGGYYPAQNINYVYYPELLSLYANDLASLTLSSDDFDPNNQLGPEEIVITRQPQGVSVLLGGTCTMSVEATGSGLTYQWKMYNGSNWVNTGLTGNKTNTLTIRGDEEKNNSIYRCVITDKYGQSATSNSAKLTVKGIIKITKQPQDATAYVGDDAKFTITAIGESLGYKWQYSTDGNTWVNANNTGYDTATLTVSATKNLNGYFYRCIVSDANNMSVTSYSAKLTVKEKVHITKQPQDVSAEEGANAVFTVAASGEGLRYLWLYSHDGMGWTDVGYPGFDTDTLTIPATKDNNNYYYRCMVSDEGNNTVLSDIVQLTVLTHLKITQQPRDITGEKGKTYPTTVKAEGESLSYQWYVKIENGTWVKTSFSGNATATLLITLNDTAIKRTYKCVITDKTGKSVESNVIKISLIPTLKITQQPSDIVGEKGKTYPATVKAEGESLSYQWYVKIENGTWVKTGFSGNTTAKLLITLNDTAIKRTYKCVITDKYGKSVESSMIKASLAKTLKITQQPSDIVGEKGKTYPTTVKAEGDGIGYQWYVKIENGTWVKTGFPGNASATLLITLNDTALKRTYKCVITDKNGKSEESNVIKVSLIPTLKITQQPSDIVGERGKTYPATVKAEGEILSYQWYVKIENGNWVKTSFSGNTNATLLITLNDTALKRTYKCVITDKNGKSEESKVIKVSLIPTLRITQQPSDIAGEKGKTYPATVKAEGEGLGYQWYVKIENGSWVKTGFFGNMTDTLRITLNDAALTRTYKCVITDKHGNTIETNLIKVIVSDEMK